MKIIIIKLILLALTITLNFSCKSYKQSNRSKTNKHKIAYQKAIKIDWKNELEEFETYCFEKKEITIKTLRKNRLTKEAIFNQVVNRKFNLSSSQDIINFKVVKSSYANGELKSLYLKELYLMAVTELNEKPIPKDWREELKQFNKLNPEDQKYEIIRISKNRKAIEIVFMQAIKNRFRTLSSPVSDDPTEIKTWVRNRDLRDEFMMEIYLQRLIETKIHFSK